MGVIRELIDIGGGLFEGRMRKKMADTGFKPFPARRYIDDWPTVLFECGVSQSLEDLHKDARWWLTNSEQEDVKTVILVKASFC